MNQMDAVLRQAANVDYMRSICPEYQSDGVCTAVAMSFVLDTDFDIAVYALYTATGKRPGKITWPEYLRSFKTLGYTAEKVHPSEYKAKTCITLERDAALKTGAYIASVSGGQHVVALVNGKVLDWTEGRRHRVDTVYRIVKSEA